VVLDVLLRLEDLPNIGCGLLHCRLSAGLLCDDGCTAFIPLELLNVGGMGTSLVGTSRSRSVRRCCTARSCRAEATTPPPIAGTLRTARFPRLPDGLMAALDGSNPVSVT